MRKLVALADRTAVLFLGVAAGAAIGFAFGRGGEKLPLRPPSKPAPTAVATSAAARGDAAGFECALPFQQHLLDTVTAGRPVAIGVFGDSFGDGVWSALYRLLPAQERFRVLKYSQQSTGFTRYSSLNLEEHAQAQLAADGPIDVAVISFGANDTQGVYAGGHAAALMSPDWQRVIGERVDRFVALMRSKGAMVYWVGLPKMRASAFDDDISAMNDFYTARMKALRVPFIDIKPLTVDDAGEFALYLPDPVSHERRLLRANDGVHMSMNGYVVITRALAARIKAYVAAAKVMAGVGEAAPATPPPVHLAAPDAVRPERARHEEHKRRKPEEGEAKHGARARRDAGKEEAPPATHRGEDRPSHPREGGERAPPVRKHEEKQQDRSTRSSDDAKPRSGDEDKSREAKTSEAKSSMSRSGERGTASGEGKRADGRDKPGDGKSRSTEARTGAREEKPRSGEAKSPSGDAKPRSSDAKAKPREDKARSGHDPTKPSKHRDEDAQPREGDRP